MQRYPVKRYLFIGLILCLSLVLVGCGKDKASKVSTYTGETYDISGYVFNHEAGCSDVTIVISGEYVDKDREEITLTDGSWSSLAIPGTVTVTPQKEGYVFEPASRTISTADDEVNFQAQFAIGGQLIDFQGNPVTEAKVHLRPLSSSLLEEEVVLEVDEEGNWEMSGLNGRIEVSVSKEGREFSPISRIIDYADSSVGFLDITDAEVEVPREVYEAEGVEFAVRRAPGGVSFPQGYEDHYLGTVEDPFWIAETMVTYELWHNVRLWAEDNGYQFANRGRPGNQGMDGQRVDERGNHPVVRISWYDAVVWCNALSEYLGLTPVYTTGREVYKDANDTKKGDKVVQTDADGFRLPTNLEWELAARYIGPIQLDTSPLKDEAILMDNLFWTPAGYFSGATDNYKNSEENDLVARVGNIFAGTDPVAQRRPNFLGLYDQSGKVEEWCFDWYKEGEHRFSRGGSFFRTAENSRVDYVGFSQPSEMQIHLGFRIARND